MRIPGGGSAEINSTAVYVKGLVVIRSSGCGVLLLVILLACGLGLALADQSLLLHFFNFLLGRAVRRARREGALDGGIEAFAAPMILSAALQVRGM